MVTLLTGTSGKAASPELAEVHWHDSVLQRTCVTRIFIEEYLQVIWIVERERERERERIIKPPCILSQQQQNHSFKILGSIMNSQQIN